MEDDPETSKREEMVEDVFFYDDDDNDNGGTSSPSPTTRDPCFLVMCLQRIWSILNLLFMLLFYVIIGLLAIPAFLALGCCSLLCFGLIGIQCFFAYGPAALLYVIYFHRKEESLLQEYRTSGVTIDSFCSESVKNETDEHRTHYENSYQYLPPSDYDDDDGAAQTFYELRSRSDQAVEIGAHTDEIIILPGIPQSGKTREAISSGKLHEEGGYNFGICLFAAFVFGPFMTWLLASMIFCENFFTSYEFVCATAVQTLAVYSVILFFDFIVMSFYFSRSSMTNCAKIVPADKVNSSLTEDNKEDDDDTVLNLTQSTISSEQNEGIV